MQDANTSARLKHESQEAASAVRTEEILKEFDELLRKRHFWLKSEDNIQYFTQTDMADQLRDLPDHQLAAIFCHLFNAIRPDILNHDDYSKAWAENVCGIAINDIRAEQAGLEETAWKVKRGVL